MASIEFRTNPHQNKPKAFVKECLTTQELTDDIRNLLSDETRNNLQQRSAVMSFEGSDSDVRKIMDHIFAIQGKNKNGLFYLMWSSLPLNGADSPDALHAKLERAVG